MSTFQRGHSQPDLYFREKGEGPALVLFNGLSQSTANWTSQASALSSSYRVVTWDARGQGRSELGEEPLSLELHVEDAVALLDHLDIEQAILVGFSHGARVALAMAATHPERTLAVSLTSIGSDDSPYRNVILRVWRETLRLGGIEALAWVTTTHILGEEFLSNYADHMERMIQTVLDRNSEEALTQLLDALASYPPSLEDARKVRAPSCLITSTKDPLVSGTSAYSLSETLNPLARHVYSDCGHTIPIERPERWREDLLAFIESAIG